MKYQNWIFATILVLMCAFSLVAASADVPQSTKLSHSRIVRLSFVQGDVTLRRGPSAQWAAAMLNTPIQEGFSLATGADGYAEVEFENGLTARLGENGQLDFTQLGLNPQNDKLNVLTLGQGFATFHFTPEQHDAFTVNAAGRTLKSQGKSEFRVDLNQSQLRLEVFDGRVDASLGNKNEKVQKDKVLMYALNSGDSFQVSKGLQKDSWDKWTNARDQQALLATADQGVTPQFAMSGWSDLGTYGAWAYFPGYGFGWAPYEPAGWTPYSSGMWSYYPGWGYTWISGEPWGWLPFHNGFWNYHAETGWFWIPGQPGTWGPAMVNWYQGPGWVGWVPIGAGGHTSCVISEGGCLTAITPVALQNGQRILPGSSALVLGAGLMGATAVAQPAVAPARTSLVPGESGGSRAQSTPVALQNGPRGLPGSPAFVLAASLIEAAPVAQPAVTSPRTAIRSGEPGGVRAQPATAFVRTTAPANVVMGQTVTADESFGHHGFLSGPEAIHAPLGRTMGGVIPIVSAGRGQLKPDTAFRPASVGAAKSSAFKAPTMIPQGSLAQTSSGSFAARPGISGSTSDVGLAAGQAATIEYGESSNMPHLCMCH